MEGAQCVNREGETLQRRDTGEQARATQMDHLKSCFITSGDNGRHSSWGPGLTSREFLWPGESLNLDGCLCLSLEGAALKSNLIEL